MNAVEIEEAVSALAASPFDRNEFPYAFLAAFGNSDTTIRKLRSGVSNISDVSSGVLQRNNIHIAVCYEGRVHETLQALRASPKTAAAKAKFILATDGITVEAEDIASGERIAPAYTEFANQFGFFLPLAGISPVKEIKNSAIDVKATGRLNKLYVELLKHNPEWATAERRHDMNHFMARLIFCFFAEDTDIFNRESLFTATISQISERDGSNTHEIVSAIFLAMNTKGPEREKEKLPGWATAFPYVNGGLFSGSTETPRFTRTARSFLINAGELNWREINPDIFGSMIQAVAEDEERGELGMHYTSVPNILKVLNPLFLDDLRNQFRAAGDNARALLNLRKRMARIRVFDPACGSGNFLVIAYKEIRKIEAEINILRGESDRRTEIPLTNFRGIELRDFPAEIARLALIIAEYQCDVLYRGQKEALKEFLPLDALNWIVSENALHLDWLTVCPPEGTGVKFASDDLFHTPLDQAQIDFENEGGETFICGNPPYKGSQTQTDEQKSDMKAIFDGKVDNWKSLDYVAAWFLKAADYGMHANSAAAFVATNSICQGRQVGPLWTAVFARSAEIIFAHSSFKWANLASHNAGVTVVIVGISAKTSRQRLLYSENPDGAVLVKAAENISPYLVSGPNVLVHQSSKPLSLVNEMNFGSMPNDGGFLLLDFDEAELATQKHGVPSRFLLPFLGSHEFIQGNERRCIWVRDDDYEIAQQNVWLQHRFNAVREKRQKSDRKATKSLAALPYRFGEVRQRGSEVVTVVPSVSSESREYLPVGLKPAGSIVSNLAFFMSDAPLWNLAMIASKLHLVWISAVCGKLETRYRYSNTLGWNTYPVPRLTDANKADLIRSGGDILLAREAHYPKTVAELYDPEHMPRDLRSAHDRNDEVVERIYIGRRFNRLRKFVLRPAYFLVLMVSWPGISRWFG